MSEHEEIVDIITIEKIFAVVDEIKAATKAYDDLQEITKRYGSIQEYQSGSPLHKNIDQKNARLVNELGKMVYTALESGQIVLMDKEK